jgi:hypothetical protein
MFIFGGVVDMKEREERHEAGIIEVQPISHNVDFSATSFFAVPSSQFQSQRFPTSKISSLDLSNRFGQ